VRALFPEALNEMRLRKKATLIHDNMPTRHCR
jgi:hypothetical protein